MKKYVILLVIPFLFSCDNRTTNPEDMLWAWLHVYDNASLIYDEVLDDTDNGYLIMINEDITLSKFVNITYSELPSEEEEEIARDYIVLAARPNYFTRCYQCSYQDTMIVDVSGGLSPIPAQQICGAIFTDDHYSVRNEAFHVIQDSIIVYGFITNGYGQFVCDSLAFGNYDLMLQSDFPDGTLHNFMVDEFYKDYYFDLYPELP